MTKYARRSTASLLGLLLLPACQVAFGDFEIDTTRLVVSCFPNATRCDGARIETCVDGSEWHVLATCSNADLCNLATLTCAPCEAGSSRCNAAVPERCGADSKWGSATPCASAALCTEPDDGSPARCSPPACPVPGQLQCVGDHLQRCAVTQTEWQDIEVCASAALCDAEAATARVAAGKLATCDIPACSPGPPDCDAGSPEPCNASCVAPVCAPGAFRCSLSALEHCPSDGGGWALVEQCQNRLLCSPESARCLPPQCPLAGAKRCKENQPQQCREDLTGWENLAPCAETEHCDATLGCVR